MVLDDMHDYAVLRNIRYLEEYLIALQRLLEKCVILVAVKDTTGLCLTDGVQEKLCRLGLRKDLRGRGWYGYVAAVQPMTPVTEILSEKNACVDTALVLGGGEKVRLVSQPFRSGNLSRIEIDGKDWSSNRRGLNIVVYDPANRYVVDSVAFDTHLADFRCHRSAAFDATDCLDEIREKLGKMKEEDKQSLVKTQLLLYHNNHRILEERAHRKLMRGKPLRVFFLVDDAAKFPSRSVYEEMVRRDAFDPYVFIIHAGEGMFFKDPEIWNEARRSYEWFRSHGYRTIFGYDENKKSVGLERFLPDLLFVQNPNLGISSYHPSILNYNYLVCYVSYGLGTVNAFSYHYEYFPKNAAWKVFSQHRIAHELAIEKSSWHGINYVLSGYPRLDSYRQYRRRRDGARKLVVIAMHWSVRRSWDVINMAVFHLYHKQLMALLDEFPEVDFCFKPHPVLRVRLRELEMAGTPVGMTSGEYDAYLEAWASHKNGMVMREGDYIELFVESDALITDCGSFIAEYLPSGHPCIYMLNPERNMDLGRNYNELGVKILSSYYLCKSWEETRKAFEEVVVQGNDSKREERRQALESSFTNVGTAGNFIVDYVEGVLGGRKEEV